jgi:O-antigen/teichoic acid export membrane protein
VARSRPLPGRSAPGPAPVHTPTESGAQLRGSTVLLGGRLVSVLIGFGTQVLLVRSLAKDDYGLFALGLAVVAAVRIAVSAGHNRTISRFFSIYRERADAPRLLGTLVMEAGLIVGLGTVALAAALGTWLVRGAQPEGLTALLAFFIVLAPLEALEELLESLFASFGRVRAILLRQHLVSPVLRLTVVATLALTGAGVTLVAVGYLLSTAVGVLIYALLLRGLLRTDPVLAGARGPLVYPAREVFGYSLPMLSTELVYLSTGSLNAVLLGALRGPAQVAGLRAVLPFADVNLLVRRQFHRLFLPLASVLHERRATDGLREAYWRSASWVAVLTFPLYALTGPLAEPLTSLLLGPRYASSATYLAVLATAFYVNAALGFNAEVLQAVARLRYLVVVNLLTAAVALGGSLAAARPFGALGVVGATAAAVLLQNLLNQLGLRGVLGAALPPAPYRRVYLVVVAAGGALTLLQQLVHPPLAASVPLVGVLSLAVAAASRRALQPAESFPGLRRVPGVRHLL